MLHVLKARKSTEAQRVELLRERAERTILQRWNQMLRDAKSPAMLEAVTDLLGTGDVEGVLSLLDAHIAAFAAAHAATFVAIGTKEAEHLSGKLTLRKAEPTVSLSFDPSDDSAAELMRRNKLNLIANLTRQQRTVVRAALVSGLRQGLGAAAMARTFRNSIGLTDQGQQQLAAFERAQRAARDEQLQLPEDEREPISSDAHIDRLVDAKQRQLLQARAEAIARTESHRITVQARDEATRQSMQATGISRTLTGKEWNSTGDGRTRDSHAERDGMRRRLDDDFAPGIGKPGDGDAAESVNCRCVLTYEFFDDEEELRAWLEAGT